MLKKHLEYLSKFGSVRIQRYTDFLLKNPAFKEADKKLISLLPEYYNEHCVLRSMFSDIMTVLNLWYTLYLTNY